MCSKAQSPSSLNFQCKGRNGSKRKGRGIGRESEGEVMVYLFGVPMPPGMSWIFSKNFQDLESPGIYLWFNLTNIPIMYRTPCVNKLYEVFLPCANRTVSLQLVMNVLQWIVVSQSK